MNILFLMCGNSNYFKQSGIVRPKYIINIKDSLMVEHVIKNYRNINAKHHFIIKREHVKQYKLDNIIKILSPKANIITLENDTRGALCTALCAIDYINSEEELLIVNGDQFIETDIASAIDKFSTYDAGLLSFHSVDPRYSYVQHTKDDIALEIAEKNPITNAALCGLYYFKNGMNFITGAQKVLEKDANIDGMYFISSVFNELILLNKTIKVMHIEKLQYHLFSTPEDITRFEKYHAN